MDLMEIALVGLFLLIIVLLMKVFSLSSQINSVTSILPELKGRIDSIDTPAKMLTDVTAALQTQVGGINESISTMSQSITNISVQATKIEEIGKKYEETESLTRQIHRIMIGSYEKGRSGENILENMMSELMKIGFVKHNSYVGGKIVEYSVQFSDGKMLAIDSKVIATREVERLFDEEIGDPERIKLRSHITSEMKKKIVEVSQYIDPQTTLPCAVMAVPDSIVSLISSIVPDAMKSNVLVAGYSAVPQLIVYFIRIHGFYSIQEDVATMKDRLMKIQQEVSKLDDKFFANRFERPVTMLQNSILQTRSVVSGLNAVLQLEYRNPDDTKLIEESSEKAS